MTIRILSPILLFLTSTAFSASFQNTTNFQGFSGVINTPTAEVIEDGKVEFQYSNQVDAVRIRDEIDQYKASQYFINIGIMPNVEFSGRLANIEDKHPSNRPFLDRDLSASLKYQLPIYGRYIPKIAIGRQDLSGTADRYNANFIVLTQQYAFVRGSVGYGFSSEHLDGIFGSLEVKGTEWLYLLSEYDSRDTRVGFRLTTPKNLLNGFQVSFTGNKNLTDEKEQVSFALNLKMALGSDHQQVTEPQLPIVQDQALVSPHTVTAQANVDTQTELYYRLKTLAQKLEAAGLENIDVGVENENLYVAYENNIFGQNELDALGVVLGVMAQTNIPLEYFTVVVKKSNQKVKSIHGDLTLYKQFLNAPSPDVLQQLKSSLKVTAPSDTSNCRMVVVNANSSYFKTRVDLTPGLKTFVATEIGAFDYLLSFRPYIHWNIYQGIDIGVVADFPLLNSHNFDEDTGVFRTYNEGNQILSAMVHRSDVFGNWVNVLSLGMYDDYLGGFENLTYSQDVHTLSLEAGYLEDDTQKIDIRKVYLAGYSYYIPAYDAFLSCRVGKYYNQDNGFDLSFKRFFGDTAITLFYQDTTQQFAGVGVELPLTPRKVPYTHYVQFNGKSDFSYSVRSSIKDPEGENNVNPGGAIVPDFSFDIESKFLNRNRLNLDYLQRHLLRLRDAYLTYRE